MSRAETIHPCPSMFVRLFCAVSVLFLSCGPSVPYGKLSFGDFAFEGVVDQDYLEAQMAPLEPMFQACYAQSLRRNHKSEGRIRLALEGGSGKLVGKVVDNPTGDEGLGKCVTDAIATIPLVERGGKGPWAFTADWSVKFEIARLKTGKKEEYGEEGRGKREE